MKFYQKLCYFRLLSIFHQIWIENEHWQPQTYIFAILIDIKNIIKIDDVIGIAQYLANKQNFLYIYLFSRTNEIISYALPFRFVFVLS